MKSRKKATDIVKHTHKELVRHLKATLKPLTKQEAANVLEEFEVDVEALLSALDDELAGEGLDAVDDDEVREEDDDIFTDDEDD